MDVCGGGDGGFEETLAAAAGCGGGCAGGGGVDGCGKRVKGGGRHAAGCGESDGFGAVVGVVGAGAGARGGSGSGGRSGGAGCWVEECSDGCHSDGGVAVKGVAWV